MGLMTRSTRSLVLLAGLLGSLLAGRSGRALAAPQGASGTGPASAPSAVGTSPYPATWLHALVNRPEFNLLSSPPQAEARLEGLSGSILGVTPLTLPGNMRGTYRLSIRKPGYAQHRARLDFKPSGPDHALGHATPASPSPILAWASPPGYLELRQGTTWRGTSYMTGEVTAIAGAVWAHRKASSTASLEQSYAQQAAAATGSRRDELANLAERYASRSQAWARSRSQWLMMGAGLWTLNALERTTFSASNTPAVDAAGNVAVDLRPLTRGAVAMRSALLPGWGQAYAGRMQAAGGFMTAGLSLLTGVVLTDQAYKRTASELAFAELEYDRARRVGETETEAAQARLDHASDVADAAWSTRQLAILSTAALWTYNLFDAVYFARGPQIAGAAGAAPSTPTVAAAAPAVRPLSPLGGKLGVEIRF
jgi:hypothetical protein